MRGPRRVGPERVWVERSVLDRIYAEADLKAPLETGGMLVGYCGIDPPEVVVTDVIGGGPAAIETEESFCPDGPWQREELAGRYRDSGRITTYLGDWHSHPAGIAAPSSRDRRTAKKISRTRDARMARPLTLILSCDDGEWSAFGYRYSRRRFWSVKIELF